MTWDPDTAAELAQAREVEVVVPAPGSPAARTPIWIVAVDGDLYVRSWKGDSGHWYRRARRHHIGSIATAGREHPVRFVPVTGAPELNAQIDQAYLNKYGSSPYAKEMTRPPAGGTTMRLESAG